MTPEAKQFAEEWAEHEGWPDSSDKAAMAKRFDAATAKLRLTPDCKCIEQGYPEQDCRWHGEVAQQAKQAAEEWRVREFDKGHILGKQSVDAYAEGYAAATAKLREAIYMWLGQWRDTLPPHAVTDLQDVLGPLTPDCKCVEQGYPEQDCTWHGK